MRTVRKPRREISQPIDIIRDLQDVVADIAHAINTHETIFPVSGTALDGPGGSAGAGSGLTHPQVMARASLRP